MAIPLIAIIYISIHALRGEGDAVTNLRYSLMRDFYPRPPWGGRRSCLCNGKTWLRISIHALRGEGDAGPVRPWRRGYISIHALRGEGDLQFTYTVSWCLCISIHALRGEGDKWIL